WRRAFGTPDYRGSGLIRRLDRWVARLIGYDRARPDYAMLIAIPERLAAHAAQLRARAEAYHAALETLKAEKRSAAGLDPVEQAAAAADAALAEADRALAEAEAALA